MVTGGRPATPNCSTTSVRTEAFHDTSATAAPTDNTVNIVDPVERRIVSSRVVKPADPQPRATNHTTVPPSRFQLLFFVVRRFVFIDCSKPVGGRVARLTLGLTTCSKQWQQAMAASK